MIQEENIITAEISTDSSLKAEIEGRGLQGPPGPPGPQGPPGKDGKDGATPQKGIDYLTELEANEFVEKIKEDATNTFNINATEKIKEFNKNAASYDERIKINNQNIQEIESNLFYTKSTSGETIVIKDSINHQLKSIKIDGNSYQDGIPNIDSPKKIKAVKGITNLLNSSDCSNINYIVDNDNYISAKNTTVDDRAWSYLESEFKITLPAGSYTFSRIFKKKATNANEAFIILDDDNNRIVKINKNISSTFTLTKTTNIGIMLKIFDGIVRLQLEEGSIAHDYVPYGTWLEQKSTGKNLLPNYIESQTKNGVTFIRNPDGSITLNGTSTVVTVLYLLENKIVDLKEESYMISSHHSGSLDGGNVYINLLDENDSQIIAINLLNSNNGSFSLQNSRKLKNATLLIGTGCVFNNFRIYPMLEKHNIVTNYEPYKEDIALIDMNIYDENDDIVGNQELLSIGDVKDTIENNMLTKRVGKYCITGDEDISVENATENTKRFIINNIPNAIYTSNRGKIISNYFKYGDVGNDVGIAFMYHGCFFIYPPAQIDTVELCKEWLSIHNVVVYYELDTPVVFELNKFNMLHSYLSTTNIFTLSEIKPIITCEYYCLNEAESVEGPPGPTGSPGKGIKSIKEYFQVSESNSVEPTTWVEIAPALTSVKKYLWNYLTITYTDDTTYNTSKKVIGVYGDTGQQGPEGITFTSLNVVDLDDLKQKILQSFTVPKISLILAYYSSLGRSYAFIVLYSSATECTMLTFGHGVKAISDYFDGAWHDYAL